MAAIQATDGPRAADDLAVRAPQQRRTREQWDRILAAGLSLLEQGGYEAFTIPALCERAQVPPRALYARAATKDALFLAVYEHGMSRLRASEHVFTDLSRWQQLDYRQRIERAVTDLVGVFTDNQAFLRSVVLISGAHPEVLRRGEGYRASLSALFATAITRSDAAEAHPRPDRELEFCFAMVFAALVIRVAYGPTFGPPGTAGDMTRQLVTMAQRYLVPNP